MMWTGPWDKTHVKACQAASEACPYFLNLIQCKKSENSDPVSGGFVQQRRGRSRALPCLRCALHISSQLLPTSRGATEDPALCNSPPQAPESEQPPSFTGNHRGECIRTASLPFNTLGGGLRTFNAPGLDQLSQLIIYGCYPNLQRGPQALC